MELINGALPTIESFLNDMKLKGRASLGRTKINHKILEATQEYTKDQIEVIDEFDAWVDRDNFEYDKSNKELRRSLNDLFSTKVDIELNSPFIDDFKEAIKDYDQELSGSDAAAYEVLYESLIEEE